MASKRHIFQDPEYEEYPAEIQEKRAKLFERNARNATVKKIVAILKSEFQKELCFYDKQLEDIDEAIHEARNALDQLRAAAVAKYFYSTSKETDYDASSTPSIHPTVKNYLGKAPTHLSSSIKTEHVVNKIPEQSLQENPSSSASKMCLQKSIQEEALENSSLQSNTDEAGCRVSRFKSKYRIIIGNSSKFITASRREKNDQSTHKWLVYVKGEKNGPTLETFVKKVIFLLHSSYRPNDVVEVSFPPFHLVRRGWGEFPVRVQLHFKDYRNKPVDVIHNLKLDKTYTGLQTFGAETVVELQLYKNDVIVPSLETVDLPLMLSGSNTFDYNSVCASDDGHHSTFSHCQTQSPKKNIWKGKEPLSETNASSVFISAANDTNSTKDNKDTVESLHTVEVNSTNNKNANIIPALTEQSSDSKMHKASDFAILHKNQILNGTNAFIKCTDSQGRTLLVPHSSLIRMNSANSETSVKPVDSLHIPSNSNQSPGTLPSYILKVIPNVKSGPNQVLLIPVSENKQNNTSNTNSQLIMCSEKQSSKFSTNGVPPRVTDSTFDNSLHTPARRTVPYVHWERALAEINLDSIKIFTDLLKKILKIFPLITEEADLSATPFCAPSLEIFQSWNIGKQRASEWQRAGIVRATILRLLKSKNSVIKLEDVWSRKKIMVWCRKYAYTPSFNGKTNVDKMNMDKMNVEEDEPWSGSFFADAPKVSDVQRILAMIESIKNSNPTSHDVDEEIDVISIDSKESPEVHCSKSIHSQVILPHSSPCAKYVQECASMVNIKLKPIELQPSVCVPVIEEMILAACKEYILDIIRESYNQGYVRMGGKLCPDQVIVKDIVNAFRNNPLLDLGSCNMSVIPEATEES